MRHFENLILDFIDINKEKKDARGISDATILMLDMAQFLSNEDEKAKKEVLAQWPEIEGFTKSKRRGFTKKDKIK